MAELTIIQDRQELERLEGIIEENIGAFYKVGKALMKIRDEKLYEKVRGIANFETYCRDRWDMSRPRAYQLLDAVKVRDNLSTSVDISEFQIRPLVKLKDNPEAQREAWQKAVETAPEGKVTAAHVQKVVKTYQLKGGECGERQGGTPKKIEATEAMGIATFVICHLERIRKDDPHRREAIQKVVGWCNENI